MGDQTYKSKIVDFYKNRKRMPSYSEIMNMVGFGSKASVHKLVGRLEAQGFFSRDRQGRLIPSRFYTALRVLGLVEAGFPSAAEEELLDTINLDEYLVPNKESSFMLEVKGDSMKDAGIVEGDMVIVERKNDAKDGEIVIAEVDGEFTMKYLRKKSGKIFLEPANPKYQPIYPENDLKITAVVKSVIRKY